MSGFSRKIKTTAGHVFFVKEIDKTHFPGTHRFVGIHEYTTFYVARNGDESGGVLFYLAKGHPQRPHQIVVWYRSGTFWRGYGRTIQEAIDHAQRDGWLYA